MAILITSNAYFPNIGGVENSLLYLAKSYVKLGFDVDLVVSDVNLVNDDILPKFEEVDGIKIHRYASYQLASKYLKPFCFFKRQLNALRILYKIKRVTQPELTISRFHTNTILAKLVGLKNVVYLVPGEVGRQNSNKNMSFKKRNAFKSAVSFWLDLALQKLALFWADKLFVFSLSMQNQIKSSIGKVAFILKPGVECERFSPANKSEKRALREQLNLPQDKVILLIVGRFVRAKGIRFALEALGYLDNHHLVIVGSGDELKQYTDYVTEHKLTSLVTFAGVRFDTENYYAAADLFIMSSIYEPFGQTILEAMAAGLPVIAFSVKSGVETATAEILSESEAVFVDELSGEKLASAILNLGDDEQTMRLLSQESRKIVAAHYNWVVLANKLIECNNR